MIWSYDRFTTVPYYNTYKYTITMHIITTQAATVAANEKLNTTQGTAVKLQCGGKININIYTCMNA